MINERLVTNGFHAGRDSGDNVGSFDRSFTRGGPWPRPDEQSRADIGILTVLSEETRAMVDVFEDAFGYHKEQRDGFRVHRAAFVTPAGRVNAVLLQTLAVGQRSAAVAYGNLRRWYRPSVVALIGVGGGIDNRVNVGDVVVADRVVFPDDHRAATRLPVALDDLFSARGEPFALLSSVEVGAYRVLRGPIGAGPATITDSRSSIRAYLRTFDDRCLAAETEAAGLVHAVRHDVAAGGSTEWLVIRGIADHADREKAGRAYELAARHAAATFVEALPFLDF